MKSQMIAICTSPFGIPPVILMVLPSAPTGSGMGECGEGRMCLRFEVVETDCSENGQVCQNDDAMMGLVSMKESLLLIS